MTGKTRDLSYIALMTALLVLCAWLVLPLGPVTFTLQTLGSLPPWAFWGENGERSPSWSTWLWAWWVCRSSPAFPGAPPGS